ncbi:arylamine N-acetyltransferase [Streptomyces lavendulae subsp. lavendulae]|uniref:arylamine N-acetyltransferase family protein n=1 Tax=Streptomyces lavendulae TaxID=1914 RepID=UPI0024A056D0|nr:arylamine N-acetyltransferase [Streptomyces lavendulae]GLV86168.1 arylamine N-acetyltransferase [Streptomyces lavendulae subsp. lavendulae]
MITDTFDGYLRRLGVIDPGAPSAEGLFALQRAHLERVSYDNIDIQLGRPPGIDPGAAARRIAAGLGGYCYHLNGAFALLLDALGYDVSLHVGGVYRDAGSREVSGGHLALTVRVDGEAYWVDTGLGDSPYEPLPLREGTYEQGGFHYRMRRLEPLEGEGPGWSLLSSDMHVPRMNFRDAPARTSDFQAMHTWLSTSADSPFVRTLALFRRDARGTDVLRGRVLSRVEPVKGTTERELATPEEFYETLATVFRRHNDDLTAEDRTALWERVNGAHAAWLASGKG